ncbi:hypothetical protein [Paraliomyxa miuraensis]|uniref:hypothetical protein n=1 Tax=Paraliomyxa miuraensis TaxID=376150 RepID=UPI002254CAEA|nr:hypothetical protein [Paraliomyxa miuraensis]MCX4239624.1 hypothetical protein [Paraliomyxa miuraensis]
MVMKILGGDVKTTDPELGHDWHAELTGRWKTLGERVFVRKPKCPPKFVEIIREGGVLVAVWAVVENQGNLTFAATWLGTSRLAIRKRLRLWLESSPTLIPMPAVAFLHWSPGKRGER